MRRRADRTTSYLYNLDLSLFDVTNNRLVASSFSSLDNTENLFVKLLGGNRDKMRVTTNGAAEPSRYPQQSGCSEADTSQVITLSPLRRRTEPYGLARFLIRSPSLAAIGDPITVPFQRAMPV